MRAITVKLGEAQSVRLDNRPEPEVPEDHASAPEGADRLILGHESLGRVMRAPEGSGLSPGDLVVGIRSHYEAAAEALAKADKTWLSRVISRRAPLERWREAFTRQVDDVKVIVEFEGDIR